MDLVSVIPSIVSFTINAILTFISNTISHNRDKLLQKQASQLQNELERNKAELTNRSNKIETILSRHQHGIDIVIERQIEAADRVWSRILDIQQICQPYIDVDIFSGLDNRSYETLARFGCSDARNTFDLFYKIRNEDPLFSERPYLNEELWSHYLIYRAFSCRLLVYYSSCVEHGEEVYWYRDSLIMDIIKPVLDDNEIVHLQKSRTSFLNKVNSKLVTLICNDIRSVFTGEKASKESITLMESILADKTYDEAIKLTTKYGNHLNDQ
ncbi:hypothetical protein H6A18_03250 [Collinsella tanakaei]|uniref:hypothetical protein n=1 Tax=Collinsella tanakaei TaxID=626935 RepID=UPI00195B391F|nr:hypothetical protein [Collinsella tanakaei]MBM6755549.1 hypothetical protein [Collinsella tanakaei]